MAERGGYSPNRRIPSINEEGIMEQIASMTTNYHSNQSTPQNEEMPSQGFLSPFSSIDGDGDSTKKVPIRSNSAMAAGMLTYKMTSLPRGLALIINVENFDNDVLEARKGSPKDVENLKKLFERLRFETFIYNNPTRKEFYGIMHAFADNPKHKNSDMMICAILTHGQDGNVYLKDGMKVPTENIYQRFNNHYCEALIGKPKFFIIQACRGSETDKSYHKRKSKFDEITDSLKKPRPTSNDTDSLPFTSDYDGNDVGRARPTWEDMIIAYSTIPGYASIRDHEEGTWFIQALVETFEKHSHENMLIDLLMMTSQRLSEFTNDRNEKQTCNVELRHMYKRLYFNADISVSSTATFSRSLSTPPASPATSVLHHESE